VNWVHHLGRFGIRHPQYHFQTASDPGVVPAIAPGYMLLQDISPRRVNNLNAGEYGRLHRRRVAAANLRKQNPFPP
jgi:hypothetical protein